MNDLIIKSIDKIISGDINKGIIPGDTIIVRDGKIAQIGFETKLTSPASRLLSTSTARLSARASSTATFTIRSTTMLRSARCRLLC